jgi:hypothetical protein
LGLDFWRGRGFCFSYVVEGSIREEAGETLPPVRHNPSPTFTRKQKGGEKGFEANIDSPILQAPSIPGTIEPEPCSVDAQFEILLVCAHKKAAETRLYIPPSNHSLGSRIRA